MILNSTTTGCPRCGRPRSMYMHPAMIPFEVQTRNSRQEVSQQGNWYDHAGRHDGPSSFYHDQHSPYRRESTSRYSSGNHGFYEHRGAWNQQSYDRGHPPTSAPGPHSHPRQAPPPPPPPHYANVYTDDAHYAITRNEAEYWEARRRAHATGHANLHGT